MLKSQLSFFVLTFVLSQMTSGCIFRQQEMRPIGPDVRASLVIYFKSGVTREEIQKFWTEELSEPNPEGKGYRLRDGIGGILKIAPTQGHEGLAVTLFPKVTPEQRTEIKKTLEESPLVYRILEDVVPMDVKKID